MDIEPSKFLGFDFRAASIVASFFGAMSYAIVMRVRSPAQLLAIVAIGLVVSVFLGPLIVAWLKHWGFESVADEGLQNASGFIAGLGGMAICNGLLAVGAKLGLSKKEQE